MSLTHPLVERDATPPAAVTGPDGDTFPVDDEGVIDCPEGVEDELGEALAEAYASDDEDPFLDLGDDLEDKTVDELADLAAKAEIEGRSSMNKDELIAALED